MIAETGKGLENASVLAQTKLYKRNRLVLGSSRHNECWCPSGAKKDRGTAFGYNPDRARQRGFECPRKRSLGFSNQAGRVDLIIQTDEIFKSNSAWSRRDDTRQMEVYRPLGHGSFRTALRVGTHHRP